MTHRPPQSAQTQRALLNGTDAWLFTPGPLTTSPEVKRAMLRDLGSRDAEFVATVRNVRDRLLRVAGVDQAAGYEAILMQGSGTFGLEAVVSSAVPDDGKLLVAINGAYGRRIAQIAEIHGITVVRVASREDRPIDPARIEQALARDAVITHVAVVHCETTTGLLNPVAEIGAAVRQHRRSLIVDAMSSFGAVPLDLTGAGAVYVVSSANKCIEGVPGFSFVIAQREALLACEGRARTLSLDLHDQWRGLENSGQFRFTPPTHTVLAFAEALAQLDREGGVAGRAARYRQNHERLMAGMTALGFTPYLRPADQSFIITSFHFPADQRFDFDEFYANLAARGYVIYPGKVSDADCFRIGTIGQLHEPQIRGLLAAIETTITEMGITHCAGAEGKS